MTESVSLTSLEMIYIDLTIPNLTITLKYNLPILIHHWTVFKQFIYHLCHFEVPFSVARAAIFGDAVIAPLGAPCVDVVTTAKRDLKAGEILDGLGHYMTYGLCENSDTVHSNRLLPIGLAEGCRLRHNVARDQVLVYDDVELPAGRLSDKLRQEQNARFFGATRSAYHGVSLANAAA